MKKILMAGLGSIGQRHVRNLRALLGDSVEILAYRQRGGGPVLNADMTVRAGAELEETYKIRAFTDLDAALAERPEAVFVTNPNSRHLPVALAAAKAGCHLFVEKPIADELDGVDELIRIVEEKRLVGFVAYQFRFHPAMQAIRELVSSGRLGNLVHAHIVNGEHLPDWHPWEDYRETHPARRDLGGGCLRIQTHELDYALWLFGLPTRVFAVGGHRSRLEVDTEDTVSVLLSCGAGFPVHVHLDYVQRPPQRVCEIVGDRAKLRFDYYAARLDLWDHATRQLETREFKDFDRNQMFLGELRHFLACTRGEEQPLVDLREGRRSMLVGLAAARSLETGAAVAISEP